MRSLRLALSWFIPLAALANSSLGADASQTLYSQAHVRAITDVSLRIRCMTAPGEADFELLGQAVLAGGGKQTILPAGRYRLATRTVTPATQTWHAFVKSFRVDEAPAMEAFLQVWRRQGYDIRPQIFGKAFKTASGRILDNRIYWISAARFDSEERAKLFAKRLEECDIFAWVRAETTNAGSGVLDLRDGGGKVILQAASPLTITSASPLCVGAGVAYNGPMTVTIGPNGRIEAFVSMEIEAYLRGVVAKEMPTSWPVEAMKAQAVAARSEVLANLAGKHSIEGFDFCADVHCRAYAGVNGHAASADAAVAATRGEALVRDGRFVTALFCADCGGRTEANETVWAAPADPALRAVADQPGASLSMPPLTASQVKSFLLKPPRAYCNGDKHGFRWKREFTAKELSASIKNYEDIGQLQAIDLGDRGPGGRLQWIRVKGTKGAATIRKDGAIRKALGGLPSSLFIMETAKAKSGQKKYIFRGGGRGHGVGLCQYGTLGMIQHGKTYRDALKHYYANCALEKIN